jgi:hypothetical protein
MFYSVVPRALESELLEPLKKHYADDPEMTVIVERRSSERRHDGARSAAAEQRVLRDRRRRRASGDSLPLYGESHAPAAA